MFNSQQKLLLLVAALLAGGAPAEAGLWITPAPGAARQFAPVALHRAKRADVCPLVYRTVVEVPEGVDRVSATLRTHEWLYVYVDARPVLAWTPPTHTPTREQVDVYRAQLHRVDLTDALTPGRHVLTVSASVHGVVLDGAMFADARRVAPLVTDETWTVTSFAPTTIIDDEPIMGESYDGLAMPGRAGPAGAVSAGPSWTASDDALAQVHFAGRLKSYRQRLEDALWRLELLTDQGLYLVDDQVRGWGGAARLDARIVEPARVVLDSARRLEEPLGTLTRRQVRTATDLRHVSAELESIGTSLRQVEQHLSAATQQAMADDEAKAVALARQGADATDVDPTDAPAEQRRQLEDRLGHPLAPLNQSRYDRLGWLPYARLTDSDIARWGVRVNPVAGPAEVDAERDWEFQTDPQDIGTLEQLWRPEVRSDRPWGSVELPHDWAQDQDAHTRAYRGPAWYRGQITIPGNWAGQEVTLTLTVGGVERLWINGREVSDRGSGQRKRHYVLSPDELVVGGTNRLVVRVRGDGPWRGLTGRVRAACPALEGAAGRQTPPVDVLASPLSPCVVLRPRTDELHIHHAGKAALGLPGRGEILPAEQYLAQAEGPLYANWVLLWLKPAGPADVRRPILLVFERNPDSVIPAPGVTVVKLRAGTQQVVAVRPWARQHPAGAAGRVELLDRIDFWSRAARAVPVNYATITRVLRRGAWSQQADVDHLAPGPLLEQTVVYDYLETVDSWRTPPLRVAPLPALCVYALANRYPGLTVEHGEAIELFQDGGLAGYQGLRQAWRVRYRYAIEPFGRRMGFTTPMFEDHAVGGAGNAREAALAADVGANSLRVVHNWSDETFSGRPGANTPPRLVVLADACRGAGIALSTACEEALGWRGQRIAGEHAALVEDLCRHHEKIAALLADRPVAQVAYDLADNPARHGARGWAEAARALTARIRAIDRRHLITVEAPGAWGPVDGIDVAGPTGDPLTVYGFADPSRWLTRLGDRWPQPAVGRDIGAICEQWWPAIALALRRGVPLHCTRYGNFDPSTATSPAQRVLMEDYLRLFDQFAMHAHYATGHSVLELQADGSVRPAQAARALARWSRATPPDRYLDLPPASQPASVPTSLPTSTQDDLPTSAPCSTPASHPASAPASRDVDRADSLTE